MKMIRLNIPSAAHDHMNIPNTGYNHVDISKVNIASTVEHCTRVSEHDQNPDTEKDYMSMIKVNKTMCT